MTVCRAACVARSKVLHSQKVKAKSELNIYQVLKVCINASIHGEHSKDREKVTREFKEMFLLLLADHQAD